MRNLLLISCFVGAILGGGPCAPKEDLIQFLTAIHSTPSYKTLTGEQKTMFSELIAEAAACQLTAYIAIIGFDKILGLLDHLNAAEAHFLNNYLQQHLALERQLASMTTHKPHTTASS